MHFLARWFAMIFFIIAIGVTGFMVIEHYSFVNALYMTVITIATIGYEEVKPLSTAGKLFDIIFIVTSFAILTYALGRLTQYVVSGEMAEYFKNRKLMQAIKQFNGHVILCGFGRNGQQAAQTFKSHKIDFVVIESNTKNFEEWLQNNSWLAYIAGDATDDDTLIKAGIEKASALITTLPEDADNVFIVLSARSLNPDIKIISRASHSASLSKLKKAGADHVISPDRIGGTHMATLVSKPDVIEFIDFLSGEEGASTSMESVAYKNLPPQLRDKSLHEIMLWKKTGVNCIGIKSVDGKFIINPPEDTVISEGMKVIVLGTKDQINNMKHNVETAG